MWLARDKDKTLAVYLDMPIKSIEYGDWADSSDDYCFLLPTSLFPEVKWEDEQPRKVKLVLED